jgi:hypothetical protein
MRSTAGGILEVAGLQSDHVDHEHLATATPPEADPPHAVLILAKLAIVQDELVNAVAGDVGNGCLRHFLHEKAQRLRRVHHTLELRDQIPEFRLIPIVPDHVSERAERLAGRPADHHVKLPGRRMESPNVAAPQHVGPAHDREALQLEGHVEQADTGETN